MQTLSSAAIEQLKKIISEEIEKLADAILGGNLQSMEEYKRLTGRLSALREIPGYVEEAYNRAEGKR